LSKAAGKSIVKAGEYLLDTNIVIGLLGEEPELVRRFDAEGNATLSVIVLDELCFGAYGSKRLKIIYWNWISYC